MLNQSVGRFLVVVLVALPISGHCEKLDEALLLTSKSLGPLPLGKGTLVSESTLKKLFPNSSVTHDIRSGDSPDFHYFEVKDNGGEVLFTIQSFIKDSKGQNENPAGVRIDLLQIRSSRIRDAYGIRVGNRVQDIIKQRGKDLRFGAGHHDVYLGADNIFYNIRTTSQGSPENLTLDDAVRGNWQIISISWPSAAWE